MKISIKIIATACAVLMLSCGSKEEKKKDGFTIDRQKAETEKTVVTETPGTKASERVTLDNKGVGPITSLSLNEEINTEMAAQGKKVYDQLCLACHRIGKKFIGPAPNGILERRSPEWVMNMILVPEKMVKDDPLAKELLVEFNGSPMANQGLTEEQARAVLEYFRTL
ncbi:MAG: cytochrome c [Eudoraea sp.]|nr:cytochrome c [Eudoraea sp.]NNJ37898.1 cytochrome c [Flavobacteriaceae bacterium]MBT8204209.1 cytochrome c [Eudoraea sp.]MBT8210359.1 cytochrome c [Eudoraea sp.]MBT8222445.1 cytochrome c [Eudoraea sp.]